VVQQCYTHAVCALFAVEVDDELLQQSSGGLDPGVLYVDSVEPVPCE